MPNNTTPPNKNQRGFPSRLWRIEIAPKEAISIKTISAITAPISTQKALRAPLEILVSMTTKKTGPVETTSNKEKGIAANNSFICRCLFYGTSEGNIAANSNLFYQFFWIAKYLNGTTKRDFCFGKFCCTNSCASTCFYTHFYLF